MNTRSVWMSACAVAFAALATPSFAAEDAIVNLRTPEKFTVEDAKPGKDGVKRMVVLRGLDKITARPTSINAPIGVPVHFATFTIVARYCYSTPQAETPETTAFLEITDHRPDQPEKKIFSGWMLASSPSLNGVQHPLYDVWVISCRTNRKNEVVAPVASTAPVKPMSPNANANEALPELPEGASQ